MSSSLIPAKALQANKLHLLAAVVISITLWPFIRKLTSKNAKKKGSRTFYATPQDVGVEVGRDGDKVYDVIVAGGGTAGCVIASRLSEDPSINVLLLEAGKSGMAIQESRIPAAYGKIMRSENCYDLWTEPQPGVGGKKKYWPRAKMLGGCSSMNAMMYQIGAPGDFDEWAELVGEGGKAWSWEGVQKYIKRYEQFVPSKQFPDVDASQRSKNGPVQVGFFSNFSNAAVQFIHACKNIGIPLVQDINTSAGPIGVAKIMTYISPKIKRVTSESAYLTAEVLSRPNLKVATGMKVTRILFDTSGFEPRACGVEFSKGKGQTVHRALARKEVVLSAGAVHTPQIMLLSGLGSPAQLKSHAIPVVADLPGVGSNLVDHPAINTRFRVKYGESLNFLYSKTLGDTARAMVALVKYAMGKGGPLSTNIGEAVAFIRSDDPTLFPEAEYGPIEDSTTGAASPDIELFVSPLAWADHGFGVVPTGDLMSLNAYLLRPTSVGSITLRCSDPFVDPVIDPRYLSTQHDVEVLYRSLKVLYKIAQTSPIFDLIIPDPDPRLDWDKLNLSKEELEKVVREKSETIYHPTSTARMVPREQGGVVDSELRVYGVKGLRVADASVFPSIISGHTAAACYIVGERAAELIKGSIGIVKS